MKHLRIMNFKRLCILCAVFVTNIATADVVSDWNITARDLVVKSKLNTPQSNRVLAVVHTAVYEAVNAISKEYSTGDSDIVASSDASIDAAVASASYTALINLIPMESEAIASAYQSALHAIPKGAALDKGVMIGEKAVMAVLKQRASDGYARAESYKPHTSAGVYVPTAIPAVPQWPQRTPWALTSADQFRPGPPPKLNSKAWAKDFEEVKQIGSVNSTIRTQEQTAQAKFWQATLPPIYHGIIHSVADQEGRSVTQNARLFAAVTRATDDAMIAVFDAKYHYAFWRPITAIRNADIDGNPKTKIDETWTPFIPTPMHPEYPCAHCVVASTVGTILKAELNGKSTPLLSTSSDTANTTRTWSSIEDFISEVSEARIYDGVHYRSSTVAGNAMGVKIGELAVEKFLKD